MYAMSTAFTRSQIAFVGWMLAFPIVTLLGMWFLDQPHSETAGYLAPLFILAIIVGVTVAALVIGRVTGTKRASTIGLFVGVPLSFVLGAVVGGAVGDYRDAVREKENAEIRKLLPAFKSGNRQAIGKRETV
jgi:membrane protein DedA with SNARE-associated domain